MSCVSRLIEIGSTVVTSNASPFRAAEMRPARKLTARAFCLKGRFLSGSFPATFYCTHYVVVVLPL